MRAKDFDFVRWQDWLAERDARTNAFLAKRSDSNVLLIEPAPAGNCLTKARTPEESLAWQLESLQTQMDVDDDHMPFLEPWFGVGVYANAFGSEYVWVEGESAQTHYHIFSPEELDALSVPDIDDAPVMNLVCEAIEYFLNETGGLIPISLTDTQSPIDTATLIMETSAFFTALYTEPEAVHRFLGKITDTIIAFSEKQSRLIGESWAKPGHLMASSRLGHGISISDDNIVMLSPEHYRDFALPYNERIGRAFDGLAVHSCGNFARQLPALLDTETLRQIDCAMMMENVDPNPNTDYALFRDLCIERDIVLKVRMNRDWPEVFPQLYHPDLRLALQVPAPAPGRPRDENRRRLRELTGQ